MATTSTALNMEAQLQSLLSGNAEQARTKWALDWRKQGKKVIGLTCTYVPEEVIFAAGMLPFRVTGTWRANTPLASAYRPANICLYCTHVLESIMSGELAFLDGLVSTNNDDDLRRFHDVCAHIGKPSYRHIMHLPHVDSELGVASFADSIRRLVTELGDLRGAKITSEALSDAIGTYNRWRAALAKVYELRKRARPPLSGSEVLQLATASSVMPKDQFTAQLEAMLPYLQQREAAMKKVRPRLLVSSDRLDHPGYLQLIEEAGAVVAMDDLDTASRYFWGQVDETKDPVDALAERYMKRPADPRMAFWDRQVDQVVAWVREFDIDGVVNFPQIYTYPRHFGTPYLMARLHEAGIPALTVDREYHLANVGQLKTRVGAFIERVEARDRS